MTEIKPNQKKAVEALCSGSTVKLAAAQAAVSEKTLYKWLKEPDFQQALSARKTEIFTSVESLVTGSMLHAVATLRQICTDTEAPPATRVSAARAILESGLRVRELYTIEERIAALEKAAGL